MVQEVRGEGSSARRRPPEDEQGRPTHRGGAGELGWLVFRLLITVRTVYRVIGYRVNPYLGQGYRE